MCKDGSAKLISPAGNVSAKFRGLEKRDVTRENYIQTLVTSGVRGEELERALKAIAQFDCQNQVSSLFILIRWGVQF